MPSVVDQFDYQSARSEHMEAERKKWFIAARDQREKKHLAEQRLDEDLIDLVTSAVLATPDEIEAFEVRLDAYDEATIKALMENQEALHEINAYIDTMRTEAHKLEDGTLVFKTEDGTRVFDEHGQEIGSHIIVPNAISDQRPHWESFAAAVKMRDNLLVERQQLHEYQEKLDNARDAARSGELTKDELDALDQELADTMPPSVAKHLPDDMKLEGPEPTPDLKSAYDQAATYIEPAMTNVATMVPVVPFEPGR